MNKKTLIQYFQFHQLVDYDADSTKRVEHLNTRTLRKAAVLIGFVERENQLNIVLTKRAQHLKHHPGQISFPGGKHEQYDNSLLDTAVRETSEEIGIPAEHIEILGQLPEITTVSQFSVTPVLAFIHSGYTANIDPNEVESLFEVPASHLLDTSKLFSHLFTIRNEPHRVFAIPYEQHFIWGMTAQIIQSLQQQITH
ncbi:MULTISPECIES: CoA pyrophosphatase [Vibrio]|uniref:CoA pyrophosphatase n=1 Tax=Vibrio cortegadensis TaxID=1328770 RepID=A0ABV4M583_9VIBR|nr:MULTISPECIES: CoA pyrophosphatase [Vibrio]MDN3698253.1 CoA pyrophosphatase [Vibrio cortegadensis]NOH84001.1 CoA pyrophosphatase [Vibrio sp. 03-59-1]